MFMDGSFVKLVSDLRLSLSMDGILMPIVRLRDWIKLKPKEFMILAYDNILYHEIIPEDQPVSAEYIIQ